MSALVRKRRFAIEVRICRVVPGADITRCSKLHLFEHLGGDGEYASRNRKAERLGGLEVDDQLEPRRLYHGQICGLRAVENPAGVGANLPSVAACCSRAAGGASGRIPQCGVGSAMGSMGALGKENAPTSKRMPPSAINTRPGQFSFSPNPAPGIRGSRVSRGTAEDLRRLASLSRPRQMG
jgi:hypothetical protein